MSTTSSPEFSRNLGFWSEAEQERLMNATVAIAGAGGDGGMLALQLARMGVGSGPEGEIRLADPDPFEVENLNRQAACTVKTVGVNKATAVGNYINDINPDITVHTFTGGVTEENVGEFVQGSDLLIDETEFSMHHLGVMLAREARANGIPNLMALNIGFGAHVKTYHPQGPSFEKLLGLSETAPIDEIKEQEVSLTKWLADIPKYADLEQFKKVANGESVPTVAPGVAIAAGVGATQAAFNLWGGKNHRPLPTYAPHTRVVDAATGESKLIKHPSLNVNIALARMALRSRLSLNPKTVH